MKRSILLSSFIIIAMLFSSCDKESDLTPNEQYIVGATGDNPYPKVTKGNSDNSGGGNNEALPVGNVPTSFTKKALLEENTGEWCGWCPYGAKIMEEAISENPGKVVGIGIHDGDDMEIASFNNWHKQTTNVSGFPAGSVDRADASGRNTWKSQIISSLAKNAELGLALDVKEADNFLTVDVYVGYLSPIDEDTKLTVAIIENDVPQSAQGQEVYDDGTAGTLLPLPAGWMHSHVFRGTLTAGAAGVDIDLSSADDDYVKVSFKDIDLSAYSIADKDNIHIAAFVHTNSAPRTVYNAQEGGLNEIKQWD